MKVAHSLAAGLFFAAVSCEEHAWEETKVLHEHGSHGGHEEHGEHAGDHDGEAHGEAGDHDHDGDGEADH